MTNHEPITETEFDVRVIRDVRIPTKAKGVTLGGDLYLPATDHQVPALVTVMHNAKDGIAGIGGLPYLRYFASRGYAGLLVDRLGVGSSDGRKRPPFDPDEADDGVDAVTWAAEQPWCTGNVGMWGLSYGAVYALATASHRPPQLKAIIPMMGTIDPRHDFVHPGGVRGGMSLFGLAAVWSTFIELMPPRAPDGGFELGDRWARRLVDFTPWLMDGWQHGPGNPIWRDRIIDAGAIQAATLCFGGWHDVFLEGTVRAYEQITAPKQLVVGPWMHELPNASTQHPLNWVDLACQWWRRWLHETPESSEPTRTAALFVRGQLPRWREFPDGLTSTTHRTYTTSADGELVDGGPRTEPETLWWHSDPTVGSLSGLGGVPIAGFGFPLDQHDDDVRSLSLHTPPLTEPMLIVGRPAVHLVLDRASTATQCSVKLADVDEQGRSTLISVGAAPIDETKDKLTVRLNPTCYAVAPGHRLALVLADSDVPRLWPPRSTSALGIVVNHDGTSVTLPLGDPEEDRPAHSVPMGELVLDNELAVPESAPKLQWTIERDHAAGQLSVTVGAPGFVSATTVDRGDRLGIDIVSTMVVRPDDSAGTTNLLTGSGSLSITTAAGEQIVTRATSEVTDTTATLLGEVLHDGVPIFTRRWSASVLGTRPEDGPR